MEETQAHNLDGKFSPKGPPKFKNTVLLEIRISPKKTAKSNNFFSSLATSPPTCEEKRKGQSRGITSRADVLAWRTTSWPLRRGWGDRWFQGKNYPAGLISRVKNSWRIMLEKFLHRCTSADKRKNSITSGLRKKIRTQTKSYILPTPLKSQMIGFEKTCAWKGLLSRFSPSHTSFFCACHA